MASESLILAVVGPTASGKTDLSLELARRLGGEILSADSRQMYRELDAGTAKPPGSWGASEAGRIFRVGGIPYHLVDFLDPREAMDAGRFAELARPIVEAVRTRGRLPILAGGTGFYLRALLGGLDPLPRRDPAIRERLAETAESCGRDWLHERLAKVDPEAARRIPANNLQRVIRALEVYELTGRPISSLWAGREEAGSGSVLYVGIQWERSALQARIRERSAEMFPKILEETLRLVPARYSGREPAFQSLGYPQALRCLSGELTKEQALAATIRATVEYAKRQATWFRRQAPVRWIPSGNGLASGWADAAEEMLAKSNCSGPPN